MNTQNQMGDGKNHKRDLEESKEKISGLVASTKQMLVELMRIKKHVGKYDYGRFQKNTELHQLLEQLDTLQDTLSREHALISDYIENRKEKHRKILEGKDQKEERLERRERGEKREKKTPLVSTQSETNDMDFQDLITQVSKIDKEVLSDIDSTMVIFQSHQHRDDVDVISLIENIIAYNDDLIEIYILGRALMEKLNSKKFSHSAYFSDTPKVDEDWNIQTVLRQLQNTEMCLSSISFMTREISQLLDEGGMNEQHVLEVFNFCALVYDFFSTHQEFASKVQECIDENEFQVSPIILNKMVSERNHLRLEKYFMFDQG